MDYSTKHLTDRITERTRLGQPPVTADEIAAFAREAQALGNASLAATLWETHRTALMTTDGEWEDAARLVESAYRWPEPVNDPEWNR